MRSLDDFASDEPGTLFKDATRLPEFFLSNLLDPARVVKVFYNDPQANIRIFYYQYLKLCFQLESVDYEGYISKIENVLNNEGFKFIFFEDDDPALFTDLQFKQLIMQFFGILGEGQTSIQLALSRYPIMDTVMIYFFRSILILTGRTDTLDSYIDRSDLLEYLCSYFGVEITFHDKCIKFVQTDIFVYEQDPKEVFMAYMNYDDPNNSQSIQPTQDNSHSIEEVPTNEPSYENSLPKVQISHTKAENLDYFNGPVSSSSRHGVNEVNNSYISSEFVDYTSGNVNLSGMVNKNNLKDSGSIDGSNPVIRSRKQSQEIQPKIFVFPVPKQPSKEKEDIPSYSGDTFTYSSKANTQSYGFSSLQKSEGNQNTEMSISTRDNYFQGDSKINQNQYSWQPTKDNVFEKYSASNPLNSLSQYTKPSTPPTNNYKPPTPPTNNYKPPSPNAPTYKPPSPQVPSYQSSEYQKPLSPNPPIYQASQNYQGFKKNEDKPSSYTSSASESYKYIDIQKSPLMDPPKPPASTPLQTPNYTPQSIVGIPMSKSVFGLNVSLQFTNSFTMKAMCEPYKSNVYNTRQRARQYRDSLKSYLK